MRIARLELLRYGHFTDRTLNFPAAARDFHVIVGRNEAGKSTTRAALSDLFYGYPTRTQFAFRHDQRDLRLGARIETATGPHDIRRRKGNKNTLLGPDEAPLESDPLAPLLGGLDREAFERAVSIDQDRLRAGGEDLLQAQGDLASLLYEASTGLTGLTASLAAAEAEAGDLHKPRAKTSTIAKLRTELDEAGQALKAAQQDETAWTAARDARDAAEARLASVRARFGDAAATLMRLNRVRRTAPILAQLRSVEAALAGCADLPAALGADTRERAVKLTTDREALTARLSGLTETRDRRAAALDALGDDPDVLAAADSIAAAAEHATLARKAANDATREISLAAQAQTRVEALAREIGLAAADFEDIAAVLPTRQKIAAVRADLQAYTVAGRTADAAKRAEDRTQAALNELPAPDTDIAAAAADAEVLTAALAEARDRLADLAAMDRESAAAEDLAREIDAARATLFPALPADADLEALALPAPDAVDAAVERLESLAREADGARQKRDDLENRLATCLADRAAKASGRVAVGPDDLARARRKRTAHWQTLRLWVEDAGPRPADIGDTIAAFEGATAASDRVADDLLGDVTRAAEIAAIDREAEEIRRKLAVLDDADARRETAEAGALERFTALWQPVGLVPAEPRAMREWLAKVAALQARATERIGALHRAKDARVRIEAARRGLLALLADAAPQRDDARALPALIRDGEAALRALQDRAASARQARERYDAARTAANDAARAAEDAAADRAQAELALAGRLGDLGLDAAMVGELNAAGLGAAIDLYDDLRDAATRAADAQARADEAAAVQQAFAQAIDALHPLLPPGAAAQTPFAALETLQQRLAAARKTAARSQDLTEEIATLETEIDTVRAQLTELAAAQQAILERAGAADEAALTALLDRLDEKRQLDATREDLLASLGREGEGHSRETLEAEQTGIDLDRLAADIAEAEAAQNAVADEREAAASDLRAAQDALAGFTGSDAAANARQTRAELLAAFGEAADRWIALSVGTRLVRASLERYRRDNQGPIVSNAATLFAALTRGAFQRIEVSRDDQDRPFLIAERASGERIGADGMSEGTRDQLFLALRLAAFEHALETGPVLPFIADDVFVTFDDERAAAGMEVLAALSERTQVLFLTHHPHVAEMGAACGGNIVSLDAAARDGASRSAAETEAA